jgi:uncharacterized protein
LEGTLTREARILYFERPGPANTAEIVAAAVGRGVELGAGYIVIASSTGATAKQAMAVGAQLGYTGRWIVIGSHVGFREAGKSRMEEETRQELEASGATVFFGTHALSSVARSFRLKWSGIDMTETIAEVFRIFSAGMKVCVEITVMAADAGLVPVDEDIVAIAGTGGGSDTALVVKPTNMNRLFDLQIREIIGMPRQR